MSFYFTIWFLPWFIDFHMLRINAFSSFFCDFFYMIFVNHLVIFPRFVYFHVLFCDFSCDPFTQMWLLHNLFLNLFLFISLHMICVTYSFLVIFHIVIVFSDFFQMLYFWSFFTWFVYVHMWFLQLIHFFNIRFLWFFTLFSYIHISLFCVCDF